jgi:hypothetical protein
MCMWIILPQYKGKGKYSGRHLLRRENECSQEFGAKRDSWLIYLRNLHLTNRDDNVANKRKTLFYPQFCNLEDLRWQNLCVDRGTFS